MKNTIGINRHLKRRGDSGNESSLLCEMAMENYIAVRYNCNKLRAMTK